MVHRFVATVGKTSHEVAIELLESGQWRVSVDGRERTVDACRIDAGTWSLTDGGGGRARLVDLDTAASGDLTATVGGAAFSCRLLDARRARGAGLGAAREATGPQSIRAPMPGKVVKLLCKAGDAVKAGQGLVVVEAMKMENELRAPRDGVIAEVAVRDGQAVDAGQVLATIG